MSAIRIQSLLHVAEGRHDRGVECPADAQAAIGRRKSRLAVSDIGS